MCEHCKVEKLIGELKNQIKTILERKGKHFFFPRLNYFSEQEQNIMLREFYEFDRNMIHEKYTGVVENSLGQSMARPPWSR